MKKLTITLIAIALSHSLVVACQDFGFAADIAKDIAKTAATTADESLVSIINQIKDNEDDIKSKNNETDTGGNAGAKKNLRHTQQVDANSTLNSYQLMFNSEVINKLESVLVDTKAESKRFEISKELEELLK